jgi:hypothetical protein
MKRQVKIVVKHDHTSDGRPWGLVSGTPGFLSGNGARFTTQASAAAAALVLGLAYYEDGYQVRYEIESERGRRKVVAEVSLARLAGMRITRIQEWLVRARRRALHG